MGVKCIYINQCAWKMDSLLNVFRDNHNDAEFPDELDYFLLSVHNRKRDWVAFSRTPAVNRLFTQQYVFSPYHNKFGLPPNANEDTRVQFMLSKLTDFVMNAVQFPFISSNNFALANIHVEYTHMPGGIMIMTVSRSDDFVRAPPRFVGSLIHLAPLLDVSVFKV